MKLIFSFLVLVAVVYPISGQSLFGMPAPLRIQTMCGMAASDCYYQSAQDDISDMHEQYGYKRACQLVKPVMECIKQVEDSNSDCKTDPGKADIPKVRERINGELLGMCAEDGSLTPCGNKLNPCFQQIKNVMSTSTNANSVCPLAQRFVTCARNKLADQTCQGKLTEILSSMEVNLPQCAIGGSCTERLNVCDNQVPEETVAQQNKDVFCNDYKAAVTCYEGVRKDQSCTTEKVNETSAEQLIRQSVSGATCGASFIQVSLLLLVVSLVVSVRRYI